MVILFHWKWKLSRSVVSGSLWSHGLQPTRILSPWDFPGKNTGVGCHFLLQGIFLTQGLNPGLPHCRQMLYRETPLDSHKSRLYKKNCMPGKVLSWLLQQSIAQQSLLELGYLCWELLLPPQEQWVSPRWCSSPWIKCLLSSLLFVVNSWAIHFQMFKLDVEKAEEPEIKLPKSFRSLKEQESSRKTFTSALLTKGFMLKPLCESQKTMENSSRNGNTRPPDLPPEKSVWRLRSNS